MKSNILPEEHSIRCKCLFHCETTISLLIENHKKGRKKPNTLENKTIAP